MRKLGRKQSEVLGTLSGWMVKFGFWLRWDMLVMGIELEASNVKLEVFKMADMTGSCVTIAYESEDIDDGQVAGRCRIMA
jgi:hypothetical protein